MTEIRIGGTDDIDIMAREWSEDEPIDIFIRERFQRTEKGDLILKLLLEVAPQNIGTRTPEDVAMYCASLARHACCLLYASQAARAEPVKVTPPFALV